MQRSSTRIDLLIISGLLLNIKFHAITVIFEDTPNIDLNCLSENFLPVLEMATAITISGVKPIIMFVNLIFDRSNYDDKRNTIELLSLLFSEKLLIYLNHCLFNQYSKRCDCDDHGCSIRRQDRSMKATDASLSESQSVVVNIM